MYDRIMKSVITTNVLILQIRYVYRIKS